MTRISTVTLFALLSSFASGPEPVFSQETDRAPDGLFDRFDANEDGKLTLKEIPKAQRERMKPIFERIGKNAINKGEFARARAAGIRARAGADEGDRPERVRRPEEDARRPGDRDRRPERRDRGGRFDPPRGAFRGPAFFTTLDENRDGRLSKQELETAAGKLMELDRNDDDHLDPGELLGGPDRFRRGGPPPFGFRGRPDDARPDRRRGDRPDGDADRPRRGPRDDAEGDARSRFRDRLRGKPDAPGIRGPGLIDNVLRSTDADSDGAISKQEALKRLEERFSQLDRNEDGRIDREELRRGVLRDRGDDDRRDRPRRERPEADRDNGESGDEAETDAE